MSKAWKCGNDNQPAFSPCATVFFLEAAMALKDLLVCVDQTDDAIVRSDLASRHGSRLTALFARGWTLAQLDRRKAAELAWFRGISCTCSTRASRHPSPPLPTGYKRS